MKKAVAVASEAQSAGNADIKGNAQEIVKVMSSAKFVMKTLREVARMKDKAPKYQSLAASLEVISKYTRSQVLDLAPSFQLLCHQCWLYALAGTIDNEIGFVPNFGEAISKFDKLAEMLAEHA